MKKLVYSGNIISALPTLIILPLAPFIFILINGEGKIPGHFHEYALRTLMVVYPLSVVICVFFSIRLLRNGFQRAAAWVSFLPLGVFGLLLLTYLQGGVVLR